MGKPAVMAGFWGSHMGLIDLLLEQRRQQAGRSSRSPPKRGRSIERVDNKNDADGRGRRSDRRGAVKADHEATLAYVRRPVGKTVGAALFLFRAGRRRPLGADRLQAQTWYIKHMLEGHASGRICRCSRRPPRSRPAAAAARTTTPTCRPATSPSRTSPTSISTRTRYSAVPITGAQVKEWLEMSACAQPRTFGKLPLLITQSMIYGVDYATRTMSGLPVEPAKPEPLICGSCGKAVESLSRAVWDESLLVGSCCEVYLDHRCPACQSDNPGIRRCGRQMPGLWLRHNRGSHRSQDRPIRIDFANRDATA